MSATWLEVTLPVPAERLDRVCDTLTYNGMAGLVVEEEGDFLRFLEQNRQYWDYVDEGLAQRMKGASRVKFYVPDSQEGQKQLRRYLAGLEEYEPQTVSLREEDWATSWQKYYQPIPVGKRMYIVPDWMRGQPVPEGRVPLYLNPGLTFGTGAHPTTQLCLELLEEVLRPGGQVLDLGCGSGILAIAALALGASRAVGVDIDPKAADVAFENAALNGVGPDRLAVYAGDVLTDKRLANKLEPGQNRVVLANIVADVIIPLSAKAGEFLAPDGVFLTSGIIDGRQDEVQAALERNGFTVTKHLERGGWHAFSAEPVGAGERRWILETERLYLRELNQGDFQGLCEILQDEETMYAYEGAFCDDEVQEWLDRQLARYRKWGFGPWAVILKENGRMIGQCGLSMQPWKETEVLEIGYLFNRAFWHNGYAAEAAQACRRYAFETLGADQVCSIIREGNTPSQNVARRNGMRPEDSWVKRYRGVDMPHDRYVIRAPRCPAGREKEN